MILDAAAERGAKLKQPCFEGADAAVSGMGEFFEGTAGPVAVADQFVVLAGEFFEAVGEGHAAFREFIDGGGEFGGEAGDEFGIELHGAVLALFAEVGFDFELCDAEGPAFEAGAGLEFLAFAPEDDIDGLTDVGGGVRVATKGADEEEQVTLAAGQFLHEFLGVVILIGHTDMQQRLNIREGLVHHGVWRKPIGWGVWSGFPGLPFGIGSTVWE